MNVHTFICAVVTFAK